MAVSQISMPPTLQTLLISSSDTNPIPLVTAVSGQVVRLWGLLVTGGTTVTLKSNTTALTGALAVTGLFMPPPQVTNPMFDAGYPYVQSASGETINIVPGASGLAGIAYYTIN